MTHKQAVLKRVKKLLEEGNSLFPNARIAYSEIEFKFTLRGKVAGKARTYPDFGLYFHPQLMERDIEDYMSTVEHEVAHLYQRKLYPNSKPHGREFKHVARKLGNDGSRKHNMDTTGIGRPKKRFAYSCQNNCNGEYLLTEYKHNIQQIKSKNRYYTCRFCGKRLEFTGVEKTIY